MHKKEYTEEEIIEIKSQNGHPFFDGRLPFAEYYKERLFGQLGGFTSEISKKIG